MKEKSHSRTETGDPRIWVLVGETGEWFAVAEVADDCSC